MTLIHSSTIHAETPQPTLPYWAIKRKVPHCCEKKVEAMIVRVWRDIGRNALIQDWPESGNFFLFFMPNS